MYARVFVENLYKIYISEYKLLQDKLFVWELKKTNWNVAWLYLEIQ